MTGILEFETDHGVIAIEVDEDVARAAGGQSSDGAMLAKGVVPMSSDAGGADIIARAPRSFDEAMTTLKAYAGSLEDLIRGLDLTPSEVSVEIGLKLTGSAGFIIAKAGAETEMKVSLKWEPGAAGNAKGKA